MKIVTDSLGNQELVGDHSGNGFVGNGRISGNQQAFVGSSFVGNAFIGRDRVWRRPRRRSAIQSAVLTYRGGNMRFVAATKSEAVAKARAWATQRRVPQPYTISGGPAFVGVAGCSVCRVPGSGPKKPSTTGAFTKLTALGLIFDSALDAGTYSKPRPTRYEVVVYRLRRRRLVGTYFWEKDTSFIEESEQLAVAKAKAYIRDEKWLEVPFTEDASLAAAALVTAAQQKKTA